MSPASSIAHYRILEKLGEGGMGAVYRAKDTKLNRDVAIKVLPEAFALDPDRLARFTREAEVLASLNHPNIAAIYGVEERALILELVDGPTLADRIAAGALPIEEAVAIARQIAEALEYAHEKGVVHRDLKPANIKVTPSGQVKVLDFGLAKALVQDAPAGDPRVSPTMTMRSTQAGAIMGTAAYMSPEQAKGKPVDRRADIWSFGVVLAEMLTGRPFYSGETVAETLAAVLLKQPDWSGLPPATPESIRKLLRRCLEHDQRRRLQAIGEARILLEDAGRAEEAPAISNAPPVRRRGLPSWTLALPLAAAAALGWGWWRSGQPVERPAWRFSVDLGPDAVAGLSMTAALSPDGNRIVFLIRGPRGAQLATRLLADSRETVLSGTDNGFLPFFSPDGQWIAFFSTGKLKKISVLGGAATSLCDAPGARGGWWGDDDRIVASLDGQALSVIPAAGGQPQLLTTKGDQEVGGLRWPQVLPGGETVLATAGTTKGGSFEAASIVAVSLKTGQLKTLHKGGYFGRYIAPDHLLFVSQATIFALPFDPKRLEVRGAPVPVADELAANSNTGGGQFHVSPSGTLVFLKGKGASLSRPTAWLDAAGRLEPVPGAVGSHPRFSPDGKRLALLTDNDITVYDFERSIASRLPFPAAQYPVWTPDGRYLIFLARNRLYLGRVDGSAQPVEFERPAGVLSFGLGSAAVPTSVSPDGRTLVAHASGGATLEDLYLFPIDLSDPEHPQVAKPSAFVSSPGDDIEAVFSPDGKWIAYSGNESGVLQVFVRSVAGGDRAGRTQISTSPGRYPAWSRDGRTLFYVAIEGHIMAVPYTVRDGAFAPAVPHVWSPTPVQIVARNINYDVHPDGKRLIVNTPPDVGEGKSSSVHLTFVLNILDEVRRRVPLDARR